MHITRRQFTKTTLLASTGAALIGSNLVAQNSASVYIVQNGDTLSHIALRNGVPESAIKKANNLNSDLIRVGQKLKIPTSENASIGDFDSGIIHEVKRGDTLGGIAMTHGVSISNLKRANNISSDVIQIGQKLKIPVIVSTEDLLSHVRAQTVKIAVQRDNWKRIVVHHSAIKYGNAAVYDRAHRKRGMQNGLAYHFVIGNGIDSGDGEIEVGPRWTKQLLGGHVKSYQTNLTAIGICLVGNFEATHPSKRQLSAFTQLMDWLRSDVVPKATNFAGHRDLRGEQTICPGKNFPLAAMHARYD
ncbi:MAG: LysM peptidoglycan-binding domain-containing protein [Opitutales bacterium]|nr:LysM peptidoglycan-binding domain-containing protein [Opitutales bacterium]MDP4693097.1 LysM peptidoglycan-binding domain-containing protein [Opitutales bacterium]MDP4777435.1 LysM peptidoglycan-binding domain-containing protein [Opitutales bacterium]MDP4879694.1 LysM peptidoglycan-binding domain-containing protein [Opitutales bacterium]MDP4883091.1 LysM peptidoglycan-binding domain-containing protein [Opitutales bacterium]